MTPKEVHQLLLTEKEERNRRAIEMWNNLKHFETPNDVPNIPKVNDEEYKNFYIPRLIGAGAIPKKDLIDGRYYIGDHRIVQIAKWNQEKNIFEYKRIKYGTEFIDTCNHFEDDDGYALFVPIKLTD